MLNIIMRVINAFLTVIFVLILVWFVYNLVIRFKKFKFRIISIRKFLIAMSINLFVIYCLIRIISFFAIRV